ncbi:helix-turn-helix domain-containing protein [Bradyrhizobium oligotrophicum]|uniref:helix-turn-helix domain-containing protein n=1 Tax=Bradyrhizobium oligotrophicum TaxID=44255 RepID=UPI003EBE8B8C
MSRGARLAQVIKQSGIAKMANLADDLGVDESAISRWKKGGSMSLENAAKLSSALDVSLDWLILGRGTMNLHKKLALSSEEFELINIFRRMSEPSQERLVMFLKEVAPAHRNSNIEGDNG